MVWAVSLSTTKLSPRRLTYVHSVVAFAVCLGLVTSTWPLAHPALYLHNSCFTWLYLNTFRGEPAISTFDWNFSPIHKSSPSFATLVGSSLDGRFTSASLCSWIAHVVSGRIAATCACSDSVALWLPSFTAG